MKTLKYLTLIALFVGFISCDKDDDGPKEDIISFTGSFSREFTVPGDIVQTATYTIAQDKINYDLAGEFAQTNYDTEKKYFSDADKRWVGFRESNNTYSVIFFNNISDTEITLYKKEVASLEAGKTEAVPAADDTENHGWNIYNK